MVNDEASEEYDLENQLPKEKEKNVSDKKNIYDIDNLVDLGKKFKVLDGNTTDEMSIFSRTEQTEREKWNETLEKLVISWRNYLLEAEELHKQLGFKFEKKKSRSDNILILFSAFMAFIQIVMIGIPGTSVYPIHESKVYKNDTVVLEEVTTGAIAEKIINSFAFTMTSILQQRYSSKNYGSKSMLHKQYAARHSNMVNKIDSELHRNRDIRASPDVFISELRSDIHNLRMDSLD